MVSASCNGSVRLGLSSSLGSDEIFHVNQVKLKSELREKSDGRVWGPCTCAASVASGAPSRLQIVAERLNSVL